METKTTAVQQAGNQTPADFVTYKNQITKSVCSRITDLCKAGVTPPAGYNAENNVYLAMMQLSQMETRDHRPLLQVVTPQSVANAMLEMTLKGLSLVKKQCAFIQYGNEVRLQEQYQGRMAMARRYGAGLPQAQVIYKGDEFAFEIDPTTGRKVVTKHQQTLESIGGEIVGAWAIVPFADGSQQPIVEVMTMAEIKRSWMQGATKGESPAHKNFAGEMAKKTVISRAVKLFIQSTSDEDISPVEIDDQPTVEVANTVEFVPQEAPAETAAEPEVETAPVATATADESDIFSL